MQFARMAGAQVVASAGSAAKAAAAEALGARAINYRDTDIGATLAAEYPGGLDWVVDGVGGELQETLIGHMAPGATMLQIGYISEYPHTGARAVCMHAARMLRWVLCPAVQGLLGKTKNFVCGMCGAGCMRVLSHRVVAGATESASRGHRHG